MSSPVSRTINIYINQASAEAAQKKLQEGFDKLSDKIRKGEAAGKDMGKEITKLGEMKKKMDDLADIISGKMSPTLKQVELRVKELHRELQNMSADAPEFAAKFDEFQQVTETFKEMKARISGVGGALHDTEGKAKGFLGSLAGIKDQIKAVAFGTIIGNTAQAAFDSVLGYFSGIISGNAALSDSLAEVRQTTKLTDAEVKELNKSLGKIDTRTKTSELRDIATIGGQFNVAKEDLKGFIEEIDKANVVLGSEFAGGAEEITTELSLLRNVFTDIKTDHIDVDLGHIGNALVVLAQEGAATAPIMTDFSKRLSPLITTARISTAEILGLSATLQELAVNPERGGTAVIKLFDKMISNAAAFAQVAGIGVEEFKSLVETDAFAAFTKVLEGFKAGGDNISVMNAAIADLEVEGVGAKEVMVKLSDNIDLLSERSDLAAQSLTNTDAITEQFNLKNENLAAGLEKLEKTFNSLLQSPAISGFLTGAVKAVTALIGFLSKNIAVLYLWGAALLVNTGILSKLVSYLGLAITGTKGLTSAQLLSNIATRADIIVTTAAAAVKALFALNIAAARREFQLLKVAMGTNPLGLLLIAAGTIVALFGLFADKAKAVTDTLTLQETINRKVSESTAQQISKIQLLTKTLQNNKLSHDERKTAMDALIAMNPKFVDTLTLEENGYKKNKAALDEYIKSLQAKATADALGELRVEAVKKQLTLERDLADAVSKQRKQPDIQSKIEKRNFEVNEKTKDDIVKITSDDGLYGVIQRLNAELRQVNEEIVSIDKQTVVLVTKTNKGGAEVIVTLATLRQELAEAKAARDSIAESDIAGLSANKKLIDDLEARIAKIDGKLTTEQKKQDSLLDQQKAFLAEVAALNKEAAAASRSGDEKEIQAVVDKYDKLEARAIKLFKDTTSILNQLNAAEQQELDNLFKKQFAESSEKEYEQSLQYLGDYYNKERQTIKQSYLDKQIDREAYTAAIKKLETDEASGRSVIAGEYAATSKKAAKDLEAAKTKALDDGIREREALEGREGKSRIALAELNVVLAKTGSRGELDAKKELLKAKLDADKQYYGESSAEYKKSVAETNKALKTLDKEYLQQRIQQFGTMMQGIGNALSNYYAYAGQKSQNDLQDLEESDRKKRDSLQKQLAANVITQAQYDAKLNALNETKRVKELEIRQKQFKSEQNAALAQAAINGALGITQIWSQYAAAPYVAAILTGITLAAVGLQVAAIKSKKPPAYAKGTKRAAGGPAIVSEEGPELVIPERGDAFLTPEEATVMDIPAGAEVVPNKELQRRMRLQGGPSYLYKPTAPINYGRVADTFNFNQRNQTAMPAYAKGTSGERGAGSGEWGAGSGERMDAFVGALNAFVKQSQQGFNANVYYNDIDRKNKEIANLKKMGSMKPGG